MKDLKPVHFQAKIRNLLADCIKEGMLSAANEVSHENKKVAAQVLARVFTNSRSLD